MLAALLLSGCASAPKLQTPVAAPVAMPRVKQISPEVRAQVLALNPEKVSDREVREVLVHTPAPRVIAIHGGVLPIKAGMNSFAQFLLGMGYPEASIRNASTGDYAYGYYDDSDELAGAVAWYYERDGLRPILIGHSQGGMQVIRVLHKLAGSYGEPIAVWNPETERAEGREVFRDPLTGSNRPVVGASVSYAAVATAGGLARLLPNEWDLHDKLRQIPDSVVEFTGFQKGFDPWGGDYLGYGSANLYHATGTAIVRNVRLPSSSAHWTIPYAEKLLADPDALKWIREFHPAANATPATATDDEGEERNARMLWAAEVWYGVKKHWVLELQRLIRAQSSKTHDR
jgi:pimeloyl-ACP methyl ester carboxylesterase